MKFKFIIMNNNLLFLLLTFLSLLLLTSSTICRDGSYCPGVTTCCLTPYGVGCCPYQNAVCCGDGDHCCPHGYQCGRGTCYREDSNGALEFLDPTKPFADITLNSNTSDTAKPHSDEIEAKYIIEYCIGDKAIDQTFKQMLTTCLVIEKDKEASQKCKFGLLYIISEGLVRNIECFDRINNLIKNMEFN